MKRFNAICASLLIISILSCNPNVIYREYNKDFSTLQWEKGKKLEFTPEIKDISQSYKFTLAFRHVNGFQFKDMSVRITETTPSGKTSSKDYTIHVMKNDHEYLSDCTGDICDLESVIESDKKYNEAGKYLYIIEQTMPVDPLPNVMEFGIILEKN